MAWLLCKHQSSLRPAGHQVSKSAERQKTNIKPIQANNHVYTEKESKHAGSHTVDEGRQAGRQAGKMDGTYGRRGADRYYVNEDFIVEQKAWA